MNVLELFSGTGSVGTTLEMMGYNIISVDISDKFYNPTHKIDILEWDYTIYPKNFFKIIWASPPCRTFSTLRRLFHKKENIENDIQNEGLPPLRKAQEIIEYFQPEKWYIENPKTGRMKEFMDCSFYDVDYCMYCDWGYKKATRIWTNVKGFKPKICNKQCGNYIDGKHKYTVGQNNGIKKIELTYRVPPQLIRDLVCAT